MNLFQLFKAFIFAARTARENYIVLLKEEYGYSDEDLKNMDEAPPGFQENWSWEELEKEAFEQLKNNQQHRLNNWLWKDMFQQVKNACPDYSFVHCDIYVGEVADARFNSSCVIINARTQYILVNMGLALFFYRSALLFIGNCSFNFEKYYPPVLGLQWSREYYRDNVRAMAEMKHIEPIQLQSNRHIELGVHLCQFLEMFVLCHEIAHTMIEDRKFANLAAIELEADRIGFALYKKTWYNDPKIGHNLQHNDINIQRLVYTAPFIFFVLTRSVQLVRKTHEIDHHPDPIERQKNLFTVMEKDDPDKVALVQLTLDAYLQTILL